MRRNHVPWRHDPLAQCSMIKGARYIAPCVWISIGLEWKRRSLLIAATRVWSYDRMEFYVKIGSLSLTLSFFLSRFFYYYFSPFLYLSLFFIFYIFLPFIFLFLFFTFLFFLKQARADTFLKQGYS